MFGIGIEISITEEASTAIKWLVNCICHVYRKDESPTSPSRFPNSIIAPLLSYLLFDFIITNASADANITVTQPVATTMENGTSDNKSLMVLFIFGQRRAFARILVGRTVVRAPKLEINLKQCHGAFEIKHCCKVE